MVCVLSVVHFNSVTFLVQRSCQCVFSVISLVFELITLEITQVLHMTTKEERPATDVSSN